MLGELVALVFLCLSIEILTFKVLKVLKADLDLDKLRPSAPP